MPDGSIQFKGFFPDDSISILSAGFSFQSDIPLAVRESLMREAVYSAIRSGRTSEKEISSEVRRLENSYTKTPLESFVLITSVSLENHYTIRRSIDGARIAVSGSPLLKFDRKAHQASAISMFGAELPSNYMTVRIDVSARNVFEAADKALGAFEQLRGIWNYSLTASKQTVTMGGLPPPPNAAVLGPVHTLHRRDGDSASDVYWYEPSYRKPARTYRLSGKYDRLLKNERWIRQRIKNAKDGEKIKRVFARYAHILDEFVTRHSIVDLWGLLEYLTATSTKNYDATIKRTAFLFKENSRDLVVEELEYLRSLRNQFVHGVYGEQAVSNLETTLYMLKLYVDELIGFVIQPANSQYTLEEIGELLDQPHSLDEIKRRLNVLNKAKRLRFD